MDRYREVFWWGMEPIQKVDSDYPKTQTLCHFGQKVFIARSSPRFMRVLHPLARGELKRGAIEEGAMGPSGVEVGRPIYCKTTTR